MHGVSTASCRTHCPYSQLIRVMVLCSSSAILSTNLHSNYSTEALRRLVPGGAPGGPRRENLRGRILRDGAHLPQVVQFAQAHQLHQCVAVRRRLIWPGDHWYVECVG